MNLNRPKVQSSGRVGKLTIDFFPRRVESDLSARGFIGTVPTYAGVYCTCTILFHVTIRSLDPTILVTDGLSYPGTKHH